VTAKKPAAGPKKKKEPTRGFEALRELRDELRRKEAAAQKTAQAAAEPKRAAKDPARVSADTKRAAPDAKEKDASDGATVLRRAYLGVKPIDRSRGAMPLTRVEPLAGEKRVVQSSDSGAAAADAARQRLRELAMGRSRFEVSDAGDRAEGRRTDVPLETLRRLRRGSFPIDARLDLHGLIAEDARSRLEGFLRTVHARGERCVLVIHGKGDHSPMGIGVLRGEISAWLSQGASSQHVAAFATARGTDGGEGAVYVLLVR
jgi:DNA-nicking Smr family endonuclease